MNEDIKIYVACLAAYNNGHLHGLWIDATDDIDIIWKQINAMLRNSPIDDAEEYAIHDYEGFGSYKISEYEGIERAHTIACFIEEQYHGCYASMADYPQEYTEDMRDLPEYLQHYIDYERMARDWELSGELFTIKTGFQEVHVFWAH